MKGSHILLHNSDIRRQARENLRGNYLVAIGNFFIISVISSILQSFISPELSYTMSGYSGQLSEGELVVSIASSFVASFVMAFLTLGMHWGYLDMQDGERLTVGHLFLPFKQDAKKVIGFVFRKQLMIILWSFLLIVPGIIKTYAWSMADFIYYDEPELSNKEILAKSDGLMQGNKWRLFRLEFYYAMLYFIPLLIWLAGMVALNFTAFQNPNVEPGLGFVWVFAGMIAVVLMTIVIAFLVEPRRNSARAAFYTQL